MSDLHPDKYGQPIDSDVTTGGRNRNDGTPPESSYIRCKKCGFPMSKIRNPKGWGEGNTRVSTQLNGAVTLGLTTITVDSTAGFPTPSTGSISAFSSKSHLGTLVTTSAAHGLTGGEVTITLTTNYNGTFKILEVPSTTTFLIGATYVANDATGTWTQPEYIYIYDAGTYATSGDVSSTYTDATGAPMANKVSYIGLTSTEFGGCAGATAHDTDMYVRTEAGDGSGCPFCHSFNYD